MSRPRRLGSGRARRRVDRPERGGQRLALFPVREVETLPHQVHQASLARDRGIDGLERPRLPRRDLSDDRVGRRADQIGRDVDGVHLEQERLNLPDRQPTRIQRDDLVVDAREAAFMLADELRFTRARAIAREPVNP